MSELAKTLENIVGPKHLLANGEVHRFTVDGVHPSMAVFPGNVDEVSAVLEACSKARTAVVPSGGGVHMGLGGIPERAEVILGLGRLKRFDNRLYPLDQAIIKIQIEPSKLTSGYVLVPAVLDYDYMSPSVRPGLDRNLNVRGWTIRNSFFTYDETNYGSTFGLFRQIPKDAIPNLAFNVRMNRNILSPICLLYCYLYCGHAGIRPLDPEDR